ncbi:Mycophenolic acid acyl-glucuronide esterase, mitochondrial [Armadillidium nasatum]|uniref:Mycophenolic acid acyl-glucuronide esterase, mitochondrial n=1 Tax=Armadillidium nasatum TaxID=96803 RepID=A0A5N5SU43_9CRUS|nr:Mycophenolic acid acyl-glucuronide esterase, mitochondrial [Armadillidium nasatum]
MYRTFILLVKNYVMTMSDHSASSCNLQYAFASKFLQFEDSQSKTVRKISYHKVEGISRPGVVFIPGFMADKSHKKSLEILKYCLDNGISCVREVLIRLTEGPQVVIGSSMGGWISMILAQEMPEKFCGLVLLAPAYNFAQKVLDDIKAKYPEELLKQMNEGFVVEKVDPKFPSYGAVPISFGLFESFLPFTLPLGENDISLKFPVRLIHGTKDITSKDTSAQKVNKSLHAALVCTIKSVSSNPLLNMFICLKRSDYLIITNITYYEDEILPTQKSEALISALESDNISLHILKGCSHELSDQKGLEAMFSAVRELRKISHVD